MDKTNVMSFTQDDRYQIIRDAIWFAAHSYRPEHNTLLAYVNVEQAAHSVLAMLDDMALIPPLPGERNY